MKPTVTGFCRWFPASLSKNDNYRPNDRRIIKKQQQKHPVKRKLRKNDKKSCRDYRLMRIIVLHIPQESKIGKYNGGGRRPAVK